MNARVNLDEVRARLAAPKVQQSNDAKVIPLVPPPEAQEAPEGVSTIDQLGEAKRLATSTALSKAIQEINEKHFVSTEGGKVRVFAETVDPELGNPALVSMSVADFRTLYSNRFVAATNERGDTRNVCVADAWMKSPDRREYPGGIGLFPDGNAPAHTYNLWRGFGVVPSKGDVKPALTFIKQVICAGDERVFRYLIGLLATFVQKPGDPAEVAVVMRGGRGIGKSTLGRWFVAIFGGHGMHVLHSRHLVGNFNAHLRGVCLMFCDEAFFAGDRAGADVLKGLITEPTLTIERKGIDAFSARNRLKIMMASNSEWVVPAGTDERRYLVLDVSDVKKQNHDYFAKLDAHMKNGGLSALLHFLLNYDISKFNIRAVPSTSGLDRQKLLSLPPLLSWLYGRLYAGHLLDHQSEWVTEQRRDDITKAFSDHVRTHGLRHVRTDTWSIGKGLRDLFPDMGERRSGGKDDKGKRPWLWTLPDLDDARGQFETAVLSGRRIPWPETEH